jgi:DNA-binding response OmpR family regulator
MKSKLLLVEANCELQHLLNYALATAFEVLVIDSVTELDMTLLSFDAEIVLLDCDLQETWQRIICHSEALRFTEYPAPVVLLTSDYRQIQRSRVTSLMKPIRLPELVQKLQSILEDVFSERSYV